jgi:hypothetical protein
MLAAGGSRRQPSQMTTVSSMTDSEVVYNAARDWLDEHKDEVLNVVYEHALNTFLGHTSLRLSRLEDMVAALYGDDRPLAERVKASIVP